MRYELDGGARDEVTRIKARVVPGGITVCVPPVASGSGVRAGEAARGAS